MDYLIHLTGTGRRRTGGIDRAKCNNPKAGFARTSFVKVATCLRCLHIERNEVFAKTLLRKSLRSFYYETVCSRIWELTDERNARNAKKESDE